jgi:16S rRNA processing protein RimM
LDIAEIVPHGRDMLVRFTGYDTPEKAKTLGGAEILVPRELAAPVKKDEFYIEDLKGLSLVPTARESAARVPTSKTEQETPKVLGIVRDVIEGGGGELLEVEMRASGKIALIPFRSEFIGDVSLENGTVELAAEWFLEA